MEVIDPMARKPEVFVRELSAEEGQRLQRTTRTSKNPVRLRRATIVMASAQGQSVPDIAAMFATTEGYVRRVVHDFNERGFTVLDPKVSGGRTRRIGAETREQICRIARCEPQQLGLAFTCWSLSKLVEHLIAERVVETVSTETVRQILKTGGVSWQATKTWKGSTDPAFAEKKTQVLELYDDPPTDGHVVCVDEFGPLNLQPRPGRGWFPSQRPARLRATYHRTGGVRHMFGALDLATGRMLYRFRNRKRWHEFLDFLRQLRRRLAGKLYVICDNFSPHKKTEVLTWCEDNDVELVFTPSNASWLNWIESEFAALRYFTLDGSDYPDHATQEAAIGGYLRWKNKRALPKTNFAIGSKIRRPDYLPIAS
ncbi:IS630 family transposase [Promicromonospora aerolata]|uniref:IS630 family transposase n=1 Tax=Promicromonospora aerolata TaxID=195749 RepID=A0ABW4VE70_9MICO